jgi:hypothetical protein
MSSRQRQTPTRQCLFFVVQSVHEPPSKPQAVSVVVVTHVPLWQQPLQLPRPHVPPELEPLDDPLEDPLDDPLEDPLEEPLDDPEDAVTH